MYIQRNTDTYVSMLWTSLFFFKHTHTNTHTHGSAHAHTCPRYYRCVRVASTPVVELRGVGLCGGTCGHAVRECKCAFVCVHLLGHECVNLAGDEVMNVVVDLLCMNVIFLFDFSL